MPLPELIENEDQTFGPPWRAVTEGRTLVLKLFGPVASSGARLDAVFCADGIDVINIDGRVQSLADGRGVANVAAGSALAITVKPRAATFVRLWLVTGWKRGLAAIWNDLVTLAILTSVVLVAWRAQSGTVSSRDAGDAWWRLVVALSPALLLVGGAVVASMLFLIGYPSPLGGQARQALIAGTFAVFPIAGYRLRLKNASDRHRRVTWLLGLNLLAGVLMPLPIDGLLQTLTFDRLRIDNSDIAWSIVPWSVLNLSLGIGLMLSAFWRSFFTISLPRAVRNAIWCAALLAILLLVAGAWMRSAYLGQSIWVRAVFEDVPRKTSDGLLSLMRGAFWSFPVSAISPLLAFLPLIAAPAIVALLRARRLATRSSDPLLDRATIDLVILLFALYVVGDRGQTFGLRFPAELLLSVIALRYVLRFQAARDLRTIRSRNGELAAGARFTKEERTQLLRRAQALAAIDAKQAAAHRKYASEGGDHAAYYALIAEVGRERTYLQTGTWSGDGEAPSNLVAADGPLLVVPAELPMRRLALASGPAADWWSSSLLALRIGAMVAILPVLYYVSVVAVAQVEIFWENRDPFGGFLVIAGLMREIAFWAVAAFAFGCLYPYIPGENGPKKGAVLTGVFAIAHGAITLIFHQEQYTLWLVLSFELLLFFLVLGVWLDAKTFQNHGLPWRGVFDLYGIRNISSAIGYASPAIGVVSVIVVQLSRGETKDAALQLAASLTKFIPNF
ncbi:MAG: hypothetical protein IT336_13405 [Thermomicrobiales bacterium]|nr:hypothetical protein [Thermomicrobiales bacterium]